MAKGSKEQPKKTEPSKKGKRPSPQKEEPKTVAQSTPKKIEESHILEQALKEQLAEAKRREEEEAKRQRQIEEQDDEDFKKEYGVVEISGERYPLSAYETEELPKIEALRLAIRYRIDYYDQRLQVLEKAAVSKTPLEVIQLAALEKDWVEDSDFSKLFFAKRLKPAIDKYYQQLRQKVETLRNANSALDPEYELEKAYSTGEISGRDLDSIKETAQDKITDLEINRDLAAEAVMESDESPEAVIAKESYFGAVARRKAREDLISAAKKIQQRRQKQRTSMEVRDEISDFSKEDFEALQDLIDNPEEFEKAKKNLPLHLVEAIEELMQEKLVKKPLQEKIRAKTEEIEANWFDLQARLAAGDDPLATVNHNLAAIHTFLDSLEELKQLKIEFEQIGKQPEIAVSLPEAGIKLPEEKATFSHAPLAAFLEMKFEEDAYRLSVKVAARKAMEARDKAIKAEESKRLAKKITILSELMEAKDVKRTYDKMLKEGRISPALDQEIRGYIHRASQKLVKESLGISTKK